MFQFSCSFSTRQFSNSSGTIKEEKRREKEEKRRGKEEEKKKKEETKKRKRKRRVSCYNIRFNFVSFPNIFVINSSCNFFKTKMAPTKKKVPQKNTMTNYLTASSSSSFYKQKLSAAVEHSRTVTDNLNTTLELNTNAVNSDNIIEHEEMPATSTAVNKETDGNKREIENKKLIKLTVHQAQRIAKLECKLERTEKVKSLSKISSCLSESELYQLQSLSNDKKWDTKFIRICLESLYKEEPDKLTSMTLKGTKAFVRRGKFYPAKSAISPEHLYKIQFSFQNRVQTDEDEQRKNTKYFSYCFYQALKQIAFKQKSENMSYEVLEVVENE